MIPVLFALLGTALHTPNVIWMDAFEARDRGMTIEAAQTYQVWAWVDSSHDAEITLGTQTLKIPADATNPGVAWKHAGGVELPKGKIGVALSDNVSGVAITTLSNFDPTKIAADLRVNDKPVASGDGRAMIDRDTNSTYKMTNFKTREDWETYAAPLRQKFLIACGLWPLPEKTPLNAKVEPVATHPDYIVEKVSFEAYPGFLVTGNLYRPVGDGPYPGVICPHGHWEHGRFENTELCSVSARCITFARMGMAAFCYDMVGYNDSKQFPRGWGHSGGNISEEQRRLEGLWGIHPFAMQLWSAVRALDFMETLPYVNKDKLACTGASGGGTQTFALCAIDQRVKVSAPVNMISHTMQGGCPCENAPIIRFNASNMEVGSLMAPRPMMMIAATGDWTRDTPRVEYPAIKTIYALYGAENDVDSVQIDAGHNYNKLSREGVYRFFGKHLLGGDNWANFTEPAYEMEPVDKLAVFPGDAKPEGYPTGEQIVAQLKESRRAKWNAILPANAAGLDAFREKARPALINAMGLSLPTAGEIGTRDVQKIDRGDYTLVRMRIGVNARKESLPVLLYVPASKAMKGTVVIAQGAGKAALADIETGGPGPLVKALLADGRAVLAFDAFLIGEHNAPDKRTDRLKKAFPDTFLPTDTAYRVQDTLTAIAYARGSEYARGPVDVIGIGDGGLWSVLAAGIDGDVRAALIDANQFDADSDAAWSAGPYIPSIRSLGDITSASVLVAPHRLNLFNAGTVAAWTNAASAYARAADVSSDGIIKSDAISPEAIVAALQ
ncbi:MAG: acetylxylan esterase [Candidatus Hydrogenedentes bacterium]|nr:acetylxylan esterase [Candidatus Hydrogenedentota bacterium]